MNAENPNEWIANPPWKVSQSDLQKIGRQMRFGYLTQKITQGESHKVKGISIVLATIDKYQPIKTSDIIKKSGLSIDSVNHTLKILKEKNLVAVKELKRENNKKIYTLNRVRAINYYSSLLFRKGYTQLKKIKGSMKSDPLLFLTIWRDVKKRLPLGWEKWEINLSPKERKRFNRTKKRIIELHNGKQLLIYYYAGIYCRKCFEEGNIVKLKQTSDNMMYCTSCHDQNPFEEEMPIRIRKKRKSKRRLR